MKLETSQHQAIAARAQWYFDVTPGGYWDRGDPVVLTGQGLPDLNSAIAFVSRYPTARIICEVGTMGTISLGNAFPKYLQCDIQDIYAVKEAFIAYWGSVAKPTIDPRPIWPFSGSTYTVMVYPSSGTSAGVYAGTIEVQVGAAHQIAHPVYPSGGTYWSGTLTGTYFDGIVGTL